MASLHDLQARMIDSLLCASADADPAVALIDALPAAAAARLEIHRHTVRSNLAEALGSAYPAVRRLVGAGYFQRIAAEFGSLHPSRAGDLIQATGRFPAYLAALHRDDEHAYLGEVARLELVIQEVLLAAEHAPLDLAALAQVAPGNHDTLRFILHPAFSVFRSDYPVRRIWENNVGSEAEPGAIDLASGKDRLAVLRRQGQLQFHDLSAGEACWLDALARGEILAASIEAASDCDPQFDAAAALQRFVALEAIVGFR